MTYGSPVQRLFGSLKSTAALAGTRTTTEAAQKTVVGVKLVLSPAQTAEDL
jgi:hypothetical protein